jgi:hypothetical protein
LTLKLGGDPADDEHPDKPNRMRWTTYNRLMDNLVEADGFADEPLNLTRRTVARPIAVLVRHSKIAKGLPLSMEQRS